MKKVIFFSIVACLIFIVNYGAAQTGDSKYVANSILKFNFFLPGISYEQGIGKSSTLYLSPYLNGIITDKEENIERKSYLYVTPCLNVAYRNYYNIKHRAQKGLNTSLNNANYMSPVYILRYTKTAPDSDYKILHQVGLAYGIQRNWSSGFGLDVQGGMKYTFDAEHISYYSPLKFFIQVSIGYRIGKKVEN